MAQNESNEELVKQLAARGAVSVVHIAFDSKERCKWLRRFIPVAAFALGSVSPWFDHLIAQLKAAYGAFLGR